MNEMIKRLMDQLSVATERREAAVTARKAILDAAEADEKRALTEDEDATFRAKTTEIAEADEEIRTLTARVDELEAEEKRAEAARAAAKRVGAYSPSARVTSEELTYRKSNGNSYIRDLVNGMIMQDPEARERLGRHAQEVRLAPEFQEVRALDRGDGNGGFQEMAAA